MLLQPYACSRAALLFAVALLTALPLRAQDVEVPRTRTFPGVESPAFPYAQPEEVGLSSAKLKRLADEVAHWVAGGELVGAELLIVKDRRIVLHEAFGWSDREERRPMERNSIFSIKSMSKPFTAASILMLEEDGKLSLSDPVSRYVPTFTNDSTTASPAKLNSPMSAALSRAILLCPPIAVRLATTTKAEITLDLIFIVFSNLVRIVLYRMQQCRKRLQRFRPDISGSPDSGLPQQLSDLLLY